MRTNTRIKRVHEGKLIEEEVDDLVDVIAETWMKAWAFAEPASQGGSYHIHAETADDEWIAMRVSAKLYGVNPAAPLSDTMISAHGGISPGLARSMIMEIRESWKSAFSSAKTFYVFPALVRGKEYKTLQRGTTQQVKDPSQFASGRHIVPYAKTDDWKLAAYTAWKMSLEHGGWGDVWDSTFVVAHNAANRLYKWKGRIVVQTNGKVTQ